MQDRVEMSVVQRELARVASLTVGQLRERYREVYDEDTRSRNRRYLVKKIQWRIQEQAEGGLSELARRKIAELAKDAPIRRRLLRLAPHAEKAAAPTTTKSAGPIQAPPPRDRDPRLPPVGTVLRKAYANATHQVRILDDGAEYRGKTYRSLSGVARAITGTSWNGFLFFAEALKAGGGAAKS